MAFCSSLWIFRENPSLICQVLNLCLLERDNIISHKFVEVIPLAEGLLLEKLCTYRIGDDSFSDSCLVVLFTSLSCRYQVPHKCGNQVPCKLLYEFLKRLVGWLPSFDEWIQYGFCQAKSIEHKELLSVGQTPSSILIGVVQWRLTNLWRDSFTAVTNYVSDGGNSAWYQVPAFVRYWNIQSRPLFLLV